jgi:hypothetical protein
MMEEQIGKYQQRALILGVAALVLSGILAFFSPAQFFHSYLLGFVYWTGLTVGSLAILMLHQLTGGRWGAVVRRLLESATRTLPLMALLFLPLLLGLHQNYSWTHPEPGDEILLHKQPYLNIPFFIARTAIYFAIWIGLAFYFNRASIQQDRQDDPQLANKFQKISGFGLLLYGLTMTFAAIDWMMSLEPHWFSTIYGLLVICGQVLNAFAFVVVIAGLLSRYKPFSDSMEAMHFHDLGNLILAFVMLWAYLSFSQYLIIWSGNLPEEIPWYLHRTFKGWEYVALGLILFHFALPFLLLLSRANKKNPHVLIKIAAAILVMRLVDLFWLTAPEFHHNGLAVNPLDVLLPVGIGGIWLWFYFKQLKSHPLVPVNEPNLREEKHE